MSFAIFFDEFSKVLSGGDSLSKTLLALALAWMFKVRNFSV